MNTFHKKSLYAAIAGLGALGAAGTAEAVHVNPDGLGQVLIYPYYTARTKTSAVFGAASFNTLVSVVNSTASAKAVKVRFLESLNSQEVLDFNLYLSHNDVWTAAVIPTAAGAGIITGDKSCTTPAISTSGSAPTPFVNYAYVGGTGQGASGDGADQSLDRTREGYIEIIEMANIIDNTPTWTAVTHVSGVPPCTGIAVGGTDYVAGTGGLFGSETIINVLATAETAVDPTAIDYFNNGGSLWFAPGTIQPTLNDGNVLQTESFYCAGGVCNPVTTQWTRGIDAVSASMMHDSLLNEYVLDTVTSSGTDWVVTYPTKSLPGYVASGTGAPAELFQHNFTTHSCDVLAIKVWSREEQTPSNPGGFSPPAPGNPATSLCYEANVITFNNSNVFGSPYSSNISTTYQDGWARLDLIDTGDGAAAPYHQLIATASTGPLTYMGLPVIGFSTVTFFNGTLPPVAPSTSPTQSAYGGSYKHKTTTLIQ